VGGGGEWGGGGGVAFVLPGVNSCGFELKGRSLRLCGIGHGSGAVESLMWKSRSTS